MIRLITIALFVLAAIVLAVWALLLSAQKDYLDKRTVRLEEKESLINSHLETLEAEWASLENRKKEILEWEESAHKKHKFVYEEGTIKVEGKE